MSLVPSVTELMVAEFLYLQYDDATKPIYLYVNSTGTTKVSGVFRLNMCFLVYLSYYANSRNCLMKNVRGTNEFFFGWGRVYKTRNWEVCASKERHKSKHDSSNFPICKVEYVFKSVSTFI
jgi:hypothetical protein